MTHAYQRNATIIYPALFVSRAPPENHPPRVDRVYPFDFSVDSARNGFTLLVRGQDPGRLELLDKVLTLVQVRRILLLRNELSKNS